MGIWRLSPLPKWLNKLKRGLVADNQGKFWTNKVLFRVKNIFYNVLSIILIGIRDILVILTNGNVVKWAYKDSKGIKGLSWTWVSLIENRILISKTSWFNSWILSILYFCRRIPCVGCGINYKEHVMLGKWVKG